MEPIVVVKCPVYFQDTAFEALKALLRDRDYSNVFILTDRHTKEHCLPVLLNHLGQDFSYQLLTMEPGELHKNMQSCMELWQEMSAAGGDRKSLLINLGGGVVTDLGGFLASVFKRGIDFIHIPTSLLAMVDAAIGGKTGVDLGHLKNQLGVINHPEMVVIHTAFLKTLPPRHLKNGKAEMWKHGLIRDAGYWELLKEHHDHEHWPELIHQSVNIKAEVVNEDPTEKSLRKILNFGHTLGHAIESYYLEANASLLHGEAIVIGMIMEAYLSTLYAELDPSTAEAIATTLIQHYPKYAIDKSATDAILNNLKHDKKNEKGTVQFVLLKNLGEAVIDCKVSRKSLEDAMAYYRDF